MNGAISTTESYNSKGLTNTVKFLATGKYLVTLPGITETSASIHATAIGTGSQYCNVSDITASSNPVEVRLRVNCFANSGARTNTKFSVSHKGLQQNSSAYAFGEVRGDGVFDQKNVCNKPITVSWQNGATRARVAFPHLPTGGTDVPMVTAIMGGGPSEAAFCHVELIARSGTDGLVWVSCWDPSGTLLLKPRFKVTWLTSGTLSCN